VFVYLFVSALQEFLAISTGTGIVGRDINGNSRVPAIPMINQTDNGAFDFIYEDDIFLIQDSDWDRIGIVFNATKFNRGTVILMY